ncbi:MAG TPA: M20 family metallo-hydrolase [Chitinophagales bacterium]|nr:M20 family metallo-hydrolase [Chitinophagales bacterium]
MKTIDTKITKLLCDLIETPSLSRNEEDAAIVMRKFLKKEKIPFEIRANNTWAKNKHFNFLKPTILLNSHIDTVKPVSGWTKEPYKAIFESDKLYGLGVNDAGAALVCLLGTFLHFYEQEELNYNFIFAATAEEEISGKNGIELISDIVNSCSLAIVGEPTEMELAVAEKGLMVVDAEVKGKSGHAARNEGVNAIYATLKDLDWIENYQFKKINPYLGPVKCTVTMINAGTQHNVIPDSCKYVIDIRTTPEYSHEQVLEVLGDNLKATIVARSTRLNPSSINSEHDIVKAANKLGINTFGSATLSDQALIAIPSVKIGPGKSERSHTADEFIYVREIEEGLATYVKLLSQLVLSAN